MGQLRSWHEQAVSRPPLNGTIVEGQAQAMGSSFIDYRGRGFWSHDAYVEDFLSRLADVATASSADEWLQAAAKHWRLQASGIFGGWIHPLFDETLVDDERRLTILGLVSKVRDDAGSAVELRQTCDLVEKLLKGELTTDASSPLDYMVRHTH